MLKVERVDHKPCAVKLKGNRLIVQTRTGDPADIQGQLRGWYRVKARNYFARKIFDLTHRLPWMGIEPPVRLLEMQKRWGSCSPSGHVILNPHLIKAPRECIEYVIVHELAHLEHHDHGPEFWKLIDIHVPGWKTAKKTLDEMVEVMTLE